MDEDKCEDGVVAGWRVGRSKIIHTYVIFPRCHVLGRATGATRFNLQPPPSSSPTLCQVPPSLSPLEPMTTVLTTSAPLSPLPKLRPAFPVEASDERLASGPSNKEGEPASESDTDVIMEDDDDETENEKPQAPSVAMSWRIIKPGDGTDLKSINEAIARTRAVAVQSGTSRCNGNMGLSEADRKARSLTVGGSDKTPRSASSSTSGPPFSDLKNWLESDETPDANSRRASSSARDDDNSDDGSSSVGVSASTSGFKSAQKRRVGPTGLITTAKRTIKREPGLPEYMTPPHIAAQQSTRTSTSRKFEDAPLTCSHCIQEGFVSRTYQRRTNLNRHIRECHTPGRAPLACTHPGCSMGFSNNYSLRRHQRHMGHLPEGEE